METPMYQLSIHSDGTFLFQPLRYAGGDIIQRFIPKISYEELLHYLRNETGNHVSGIYYLFTAEDFKTLMKVGSDKDVAVFFDIGDTYGTLNVYLDHCDLNLDQYVNNEALDTNGIEVEDLFQEDEYSEDEDSEDMEYDLDESDAESVASLDHLSEGEDEVRDVRKGKPIVNIPTQNQLPKLGGNQKDLKQEKADICEEHDQFLADLVEALKKNDEDPLEPPPAEVPNFPVYDKQTHWRFKTPKV